MNPAIPLNLDELRANYIKNIQIIELSKAIHRLESKFEREAEEANSNSLEHMRRRVADLKSKPRLNYDGFVFRR